MSLAYGKDSFHVNYCFFFFSIISFRTEMRPLHLLLFEQKIETPLSNDLKNIKPYLVKLLFTELTQFFKSSTLMNDIQ